MVSLCRSSGDNRTPRQTVGDLIYLEVYSSQTPSLLRREQTVGDSSPKEVDSFFLNGRGPFRTTLHKVSLYRQSALEWYGLLGYHKRRTSPLILDPTGSKRKESEVRYLSRVQGIGDGVSQKGESRPNETPRPTTRTFVVGKSY